MSKNWMRYFELLLLDDKGNGIKLPDLRVSFSIEKMTATHFNGFVGKFTIYNLSPTTQNRVLGHEFSRIQVLAGYLGFQDEQKNYPDANTGMIFNGDIRFTTAGKDKDHPTDSWVQLQCIDSWEGHLNSSVTTTIAAGWKYNDLFSLGMQSLKPYGITAGHVPVFPATEFPRGRTVYQNTSQMMYHIAEQCHGNWWYENNQVHILPDGEYIEEVTELSADTGLIGIPQQTLGNGVNVQCLINPKITLGSLLRLRSPVYADALPNNQLVTTKDPITQKRVGDNIYYEGSGDKNSLATINANGDYIVGGINYTGDTRGKDWYMNLLCLAKGSTDLKTKKT